MTRSTHNPAYIAFLALLRADRRASGMSQVQIAEKLGNRQTFISKIENGDRRIDVIELLAYLDAAGVDAADFVARLSARVRNLLRKDRKLAIRRRATAKARR